MTVGFLQAGDDVVNDRLKSILGLNHPSSEFLSFAAAQLEILPSPARGEGGNSRLKSALRTHKTVHWLLLFGSALLRIFLEHYKYYQII